MFKPKYQHSCLQVSDSFFFLPFSVTYPPDQSKIFRYKWQKKTNHLTAPAKHTWLKESHVIQLFNFPIVFSFPHAVTTFYKTVPNYSLRPATITDNTACIKSSPTCLFLGVF